MTARRIGLVAWHAFKEHVRDRVLYAIAGFAALLVIASILIGQITAGQDVKIIKDLGLAAIELSGILMSVFLGVSLVAREIERRSIYALLAKPLPRWEFIVGKYAGLVLTVVVNVVAMTLVFYLVLAWLGWTSPENVRLSWARPAVDARLLVAIVEILAELTLLTAVALFFSTFSSSTLLSVALTLGLFVAGLLSHDLRAFGSLVDAPGAVSRVVVAVGWVVPAFSAFDHKGAIVSGLPVEAGRVWFNLLYAAAYSTAAVAAAVAVFSRREFK
ncbi:MAG TPA: ABC transporter permease subunit [Vicinamibacterales bacterium]|nr:ABC transporter permease subunit [Vicinamibacterales bacterium]